MDGHIQAGSVICVAGKPVYCMTDGYVMRQLGRHLHGGWVGQMHGCEEPPSFPPGGHSGGGIQSVPHPRSRQLFMGLKGIQTLLQTVEAIQSLNAVLKTTVRITAASLAAMHPCMTHLLHHRQVFSAHPRFDLC
jgi:hypothetical protein